MSLLKNIGKAIGSFLRLIVQIVVYFFNYWKRQIINLGHFIKNDHHYVYLVISILSALNIYMSYVYLGRKTKQLYSIFDSLSLSIIEVIIGVSLIVLVISLGALIIKLLEKKNYGNNKIISNPIVKRVTRYCSYLVGIIFISLVLETFVLSIISSTVHSMNANKMPSGFFEIMVYTFVKSTKIFNAGISTTIRLALISTVAGFILSLLLVFLRCNEVDKRDNDLVKFLKIIGNKFATIYATVIRGTPMMVQVLIIYYAGFNILKANGFSIQEMNNIWSTFTVGFITISLNSTAYLAEVLRGSILAIDKGQIEAARSLGFSQWKAMTKVVFPQAVKNSIPAIGNEFIINIKDSVVLNVIGVMDLMYATNTVVGIYFKQLEVYCVCALIYLILTYILTKILNVAANELGVVNKHRATLEE